MLKSWIQTPRVATDLKKQNILPKQVMSMYSLQRRLAGSNVRVYSLDPGVVETAIVDKAIEACPGLAEQLEQSKKKGMDKADVTV